MLSDKLSDTALNLITKYGNTVVLSKEVQSGSYDPATDTYTTTTTSINTKGVYRKPSYNEDKSIKNIVKIPFDANIDIDFKLNENTILKIINIEVQDKVIAMDVYI